MHSLVHFLRSIRCISFLRSIRCNHHVDQGGTGSESQLRCGTKYVVCALKTATVVPSPNCLALNVKLRSVQVLPPRKWRHDWSSVGGMIFSKDRTPLWRFVRRVWWSFILVAHTCYALLAPAENEQLVDLIQSCQPGAHALLHSPRSFSSTGNRHSHQSLPCLQAFKSLRMTPALLKAWRNFVQQVSR